MLPFRSIRLFFLDGLDKGDGVLGQLFICPLFVISFLILSVTTSIRETMEMYVYHAFIQVSGQTICHQDHWEESELGGKNKYCADFSIRMLAFPFFTSTSAAVHQIVWFVNGPDTSQLSKPKYNIDLMYFTLSLWPNDLVHKAIKPMDRVTQWQHMD